MNETAKRDRRDEKEEIRYHVIFSTARCRAWGSVTGRIMLPTSSD